jgi:hypothetical protein
MHSPISTSASLPVDVGLVAGGDPVAHSQALGAGEGEDVAAVGAALADNGDVTGRRRAAVHAARKGRVEVGGGVEDAQAVGADDPQAAAPGDLAHPRLQGFTLWAGLGEARGEHHRGFHTPGRAGFERVGHQHRRHRHDGAVDRARNLGDRGIGRQALHRLPVRVDRIDRSRKARLQHVAQRPPADPRRIAGGAQNRHRSRVEQRPEIGYGRSRGALRSGGIGQSGLPVLAPRLLARSHRSGKRARPGNPKIRRPRTRLYPNGDPLHTYHMQRDTRPGRWPGRQDRG